MLLPLKSRQPFELCIPHVTTASCTYTRYNKPFTVPHCRITLQICSTWSDIELPDPPLAPPCRAALPRSISSTSPSTSGCRQGQHTTDFVYGCQRFHTNLGVCPGCRVGQAVGTPASLG